MISRLTLAFVFSWCASIATATTVDWTDTVSVSASAGPENPLILFGFNPQPEPPAIVITNDLDPTQAVREVLGVEPTPFNVFLAADGGSFTTGLEPVDALGIPGILGFDVGFTTDLGTDLTLELRFELNGSATLIEADALFFNPQPEPPAEWNDGALGAEIEFVNLTSGDDVGASLQIRNSAGDLVELVNGPIPVPLPGAGWLMFGGIGLLGAVRSRTKRRAA